MDVTQLLQDFFLKTFKQISPSVTPSVTPSDEQFGSWAVCQSELR